MNLEKRFVELLENISGLDSLNYDEKEKLEENVSEILQILEDTINCPYDYRNILENLKEEEKYNELRNNLDIYL